MRRWVRLGVCAGVGVAVLAAAASCSRFAGNEESERIVERGRDASDTLSGAGDGSGSLRVRPGIPYLGVVAETRRHGPALPEGIAGELVSLWVDPGPEGISGRAMLDVVAEAIDMPVVMDVGSFQVPVGLGEEGTGCDGGVLAGTGGSAPVSGQSEQVNAEAASQREAAEIGSTEEPDRVMVGGEGVGVLAMESFLNGSYGGRLQFRGTVEDLLGDMVESSPLLEHWRYDGERVLLGFYSTRVYEVHLIPAGETADELWDELRVSLAPAIGDGGYARTYCRRGVVEVRGTASDLRKVERIVSDFNERVTRQLVLEVELYGVVHSSDLGSSFDIGLLFSGNNVGVNLGGSEGIRSAARALRLENLLSLDAFDGDYEDYLRELDGFRRVELGDFSDIPGFENELNVFERRVEEYFEDRDIYDRERAAYLESFDSYETALREYNAGDRTDPPERPVAPERPEAPELPFPPLAPGAPRLVENTGVDGVAPGSVAIIDPESPYVGSTAFVELLRASASEAGKIDSASMVLLDGRRQTMHVGAQKTIVVGRTEVTVGGEGGSVQVEEDIREFSDGFGLEVVGRLVGSDSVIVAYQMTLNEVSVGQGALRVLNETRRLGNEVVMPLGARLAMTAFSSGSGSGGASLGILSGGSLLSGGISDVTTRTSYVVSLRVSKLSRARVRRDSRARHVIPVADRGEDG